ncbi:MAG TPA: 3D domain-containing protein [Pyrinomonadaceae bacterium]|jgi:3D (Asp-Asp-Asp) domain-containing protein
MRSLFGGGAAFTTALFLASVLFYARPSAAEPTHLQNPVRQEKREQPAAQDATGAPEMLAALNVPEATGGTIVEMDEEAPPMPASISKSETASVSSTAQSYTATAYNLYGRTASGGPVRQGIIAADPRVLPLGTRVGLDAGPYSGEYVVADTGGSVRGRKIDVWVPSAREACRFGRRSVRLTVLSYGRRARTRR